MKIALLGASGLLGKNLLPSLGLAGHDIRTLGRSIESDYLCDLGEFDAISEVLDEINPDMIINLIALTDVDYCENNPKEAFLTNVKITENIVNWIEQGIKNCHLILVSTDQVYDGYGPHSETKVCLSNYYAFSKYAAELAACRIKSTILRTNFFGKSNCDGRSSFSDWIYDNAICKRNISVFNDVYFSPLSLKTLSKMIILVVSNKSVGIFNLGSRNGLSKFEFTYSFLNLLELYNDNIMEVSIDDVSFIKTYRPKDMRLNVTKFEGQFDVKLPYLKDEIQMVIGDYNG